ncbi:MAG: putative LysR-family transcriptional regulator [Pseudomonas sp.]|nr:putative LysR-family transcriptional regulator [Pseudomonas sp.]
MNIDEHKFAGIDLNLLVVFMVMFHERNVSRAAERLHVGQPAVSGSLFRLRQRFDDPLFLRAGRGMRPTHRAIEIANALLPAMSVIGSVINGD